MICPNCGKEVPEGANNCPNCGASLNESSPISGENQTVEASDNKVVDGGRNKKKVNILTLVAILLFVATLFINQSVYFILLETILSLTMLVYVRKKYPKEVVLTVLLTITIVVGFIKCFLILFLVVACEYSRVRV